MFTDFVINGQGVGAVGEALVGTRFDTGLLRPFVDPAGDPRKTWVTINTGHKKWDADKNKYINQFETISVREALNNGLPVQGGHMALNASLALRKDEWIHFDQIVVKVARERLNAWTDLVSANPVGGFDAFSASILEYETMTDDGSALVDMDGLAEGRNDESQYNLEAVPLPITHVDFRFSQRRLETSRRLGMPLDTTRVEQSTRRVMETIERTTIGTVTGLTYGTASLYNNTPTVWGYLTHPDRNTKTDCTTPTGSNPASTVADVLAMRDLAYADNMYGPFMLYHSTDWDQYMDNDYYILDTSGAAAPSRTLRERLRMIEGIQDVKRLDLLPSSANPFTLILVQMTSNVADAINGMPVRTVHWETKGGLEHNYKVMGIQVPRVKADAAGQSGIVVGTVGG